MTNPEAVIVRADSQTPPTAQWDVCAPCTEPGPPTVFTHTEMNGGEREELGPLPYLLPCVELQAREWTDAHRADLAAWAASGDIVRTIPETP